MSASTGEILRSLRQAKKKTLAAAASDLGITPSALSNYENDIRVPRDSIKMRISNYYKKPIQKIFFATNVHEL